MYSYAARTKADIRKEILNDFNHERQKVLLHRTVGNRLWFAVENQHAGRFVALCLLAKSDGCWGYKDMDESMEPYYYDCPKAVIEAAGPTSNERALAWRAKVAEYQEAEKARKEALKRIELGCEVLLKNSRPDRFRVTMIEGRKLYGDCTATGRGPFRIPRSRIISVFPREQLAQNS